MFTLTHGAEAPNQVAATPQRPEGVTNRFPKCRFGDLTDSAFERDPALTIRRSTENEMLIYHRTSVMESSAQTLVNTVNCVGVMGKGVAKAFKDREPAMYAAYKGICEKGLLEPGKLWLWQGTGSWVLNFPTKQHWRNPSRIEWIEAGLKKFVAEYGRRGIREISFPRLGCGNGGLDWEDVGPLMERYLADLPIPVYIHDYSVDIGLPEHLEAVAEQLRLETPDSASFEALLSGLHRTIELAGNQLVGLQTNTPFKAEATDEQAILLTLPDGAWTVDVEELRDVWVGLLNGLVTRERAARTNIERSSEPVLSMLSLLPQIRPVEIQRRCSASPELAVEFRPHARRAAIATQSAH